MKDGGAQQTAYRRLTEALLRGVYPPGSRLPGERTLCEQVRVSRSTLRLALGQLAEEGALIPSAQRGWFVPHVVVGEPPSTLQSFSEMAYARGLTPYATVLSTCVRASTFGEAQDLRIPAAAPVVELVRLRGMDQTPVTVETAVLPLRRVEWLPDLDLTDRSLYEVLESKGLIILRSSYTVQAVNANEEQARLLGVNPGSAVLLATDITITDDRRPIVRTINSYRGNAYRFEADLFRSAAPGRS